MYVSVGQIETLAVRLVDLLLIISVLTEHVPYSEVSEKLSSHEGQQRASSERPRRKALDHDVAVAPAVQ